MRFFSSGLLLAGLLSVAVVPVSPAMATAALGENLDACLAGTETLQNPDQVFPVARCPGLSEHLNDLKPWLAPPVGEKISRRQLFALRELAARPGQGLPAARHALNYAQVDDILRELLPPEEEAERQNWWEAFKQWLRKNLGQQQEADFDWLDNWLNSFQPSENTLEGIFFVSLILVILLAGLILYNEIRAWGGFRLWKRPGGRSRGTGDMPEPPADRLPGGLQALRDLPPTRQLGELLHFSVTHLRQVGLLPGRVGLTPRECHRYLRASPAAGDFESLLRQAEPVLYGGQGLSPEAREQVFQAVTRIMALQPDK